MKTLFEEWQSFERAVVPVAAPPVQREEMRRAFYAGASVMLTLVLAAVAPENEDDCEANLQALEDEVNSILTDMREC